VGVGRGGLGGGGGICRTARVLGIPLYIFFSILPVPTPTLLSKAVSEPTNR
jgi:hypothetical protein